MSKQSPQAGDPARGMFDVGDATRGGPISPRVARKHREKAPVPTSGRVLSKQLKRLAQRRTGAGGVGYAGAREGQRPPGSMNRHKSRSIKGAK